MQVLRKILDLTFIKYALVGVLNTFVGLSFIYLFKWWFNFSDIAANALGYFFGFIVSYTLNSRWTFKYGGPDFLAIIKFGCVIIIAYLTNLFTVIALIETYNVNSYLSHAIGVFPYFIISYFLSKSLVFVDR
jgi:putative flippase GtrA